MLHTRKNINRSQLEDYYVKQHLSLLKIGKILGYSSRTIEIRARECKINLRKPGLPGPKISNHRLKYLYLKKKFSSRKIAKLYGCAYSTIDTMVHRLNLPIRNLSTSHITTKRVNFSNNLEEKAYMVGFRIGDLRVRKMYKNSGTILVDCGSTKEAQIDLIKELFKKYGRVWVGKTQAGGKKQIECSLNESFSFLLNKYLKFPVWITKNEDVKLSGLAGFFDAEGSFFIEKQRKSSSFSVGNYNTAILKQIKGWLDKFGFSPRLYLGVRKGYTGKDGYSHNDDFWILTIYRKRELLLFTKKILPYLKHRDRMKSAQLVLKNIDGRNQKYGFIGM